MLGVGVARKPSEDADPHVEEYLRNWGYMPQRPFRRALKQIAGSHRCVDQRHFWVGITARAKVEDVEMHTGLTRSQCRTNTHLHWARDYAPCGQTPVLAICAKRYGLSMISADVRQGLVHFSLYKGAMNAEHFIEFLGVLIQNTERKTYLLVDNLRPLRHQKVREWLKKKTLMFFEYLFIVSMLWLIYISNAFGEDNLVPFVMFQDKIHGVVSFEEMNKKLTATDRIFVRNGHLYAVGNDLTPNTSDDRRVKFFGVNLAFGANFPNANDAVIIAKRLRRLGINAVRLHHLDTRPKPIINGGESESILTDGSFPQINHDAVDRLKQFVDVLANEGIYVSLNLHVGYRFRPSVDLKKKFISDEMMPKASKPLFIFDTEMIALQEDYIRQLISLLGLKNKPNLAMVEISNESSLVYSAAIKKPSSFIPNEYFGELSMLTSEVENTKEGTTDFRLMDRTEQFMSLMELDRRFFRRIRNVIHDQTDEMMPVSGTQVEFGGLMTLLSCKEMDFLDSHNYVDNYRYPKGEPSGDDWRIYNSGIFGDNLSTAVARAFLRERGKPFLVTEYNLPWPNKYQGEILPFMAAFASFQDWDGLFYYAYEHRPTWSRQSPNGFNLNGNNGMLVGFGSAAWMFRMGGISPGINPIELDFDKSLALQSVMNGNAAWHFDEFLIKQLKLDALQALIQRVDVSYSQNPGIHNLRKNKSDESQMRSDTNEIVYNLDIGNFTVKTDKLIAFAGSINSHNPADIESLNIHTNSKVKQHVVVIVVARDGLPLNQSKSILLTMPSASWDTDLITRQARSLTRYIYSGFTFPSSRVGKSSGGLGAGGMPTGVSFSDVVVSYRCGKFRCKLFALDGAGNRIQELSPDMDANTDGVMLKIDPMSLGDSYSPWYEISREY